mmetsp:Transcript_45788/g.74415  ORF Transcript_45788/g.74415 Transcript_45788/m.74415 type:complete len:673 (-) Transcript_45788:8-2026(-)
MALLGKDGATRAARPQDAEQDPGAACRLQDNLVQAFAKERAQMQELLHNFAAQQQEQLGCQLQCLQELSATRQDSAERILAEIKIAGVPFEPHAHWGGVEACTSSQDELSRNAAGHFADLGSSPIRSKRQSLNEEATFTDVTVTRKASGDSMASVPVDSTGMMLASRRSFSQESSNLAVSSFWLPSKEATQDAFKRMVDTVDGRSFGVQKALKWGLRRSGLNLEELLKPKRRFPCLYRLVHRRCFVGAVMMLIILNAFFICFMSDLTVREAAESFERRSASGEDAIVLPDQGMRWNQIVDIAFTAIFCTELLLRMMGEELAFWVGPEWRWNIFDAVMVLSMLIDTALVAAGLEVGYIRLLRVIRALRSFRIIRVLRFFRELRVMLLSIMNSIAPLMWAVLFLALTISVFSVVFLQGVTNFILDAQPGVDSIEEVQQYYQSFPMAFFSLFMAITGGEDWINLVEPLIQISSAYGVLFVIYISLMVLGVLNIITGIFVESASDLSRQDRDLVTQAEQERTANYMKELRKLFIELDTNCNGTISLKEFEGFASRHEVQAYFSVLELDVTKAAQVFRLLDVDGSNEIEIDEFVVGCMRLKGLAKGVDMESLMFENKKLMTRWSNHQKWTRRQFSDLEALILKMEADNRQAIKRLCTAVNRLSENDQGGSFSSSTSI